MRKILIVEDDRWISASLKLYLENSNYNVVLHFDWIDAVERVKTENPDLLILDINLPLKDGIQITQELREFTNLPIVMLTARWSEDDRINWLDAWADDYVAKPFSPRELLARINTIMRRLTDREPSSKNLLKLWWVVIDTDKKSVESDWEKVTLTSNEYEILKKLIEVKWAIVSRETIMKEIIGYEKYVYDRTIDTHIKNLRKKINKQNFIVTVRWEWYRINI